MGFEFKTIINGLPLDNHRSGSWFLVTFEEPTETKVKQSLREMLVNSSAQVDCIIGDGFLGFAVDVSNELGISIIHFRTSSPCWNPCIIQAGELTIKGTEEDMDRLITTVLGMETYLRCRDLPSICPAADVEHPFIQLLVRQTRKSPRVNALMLNTTKVSQLRTKCPHLYGIGPLNAQLNTSRKTKHGES